MTAQGFAENAGRSPWYNYMGFEGNWGPVRTVAAIAVTLPVPYFLSHRNDPPIVGFHQTRYFDVPDPSGNPRRANAWNGTADEQLKLIAAGKPPRTEGGAARVWVYEDRARPAYLSLDDAAKDHWNWVTGKFAYLRSTGDKRLVDLANRAEAGDAAAYAEAMVTPISDQQIDKTKLPWGPSTSHQGKGIFNPLDNYRGDLERKVPDVRVQLQQAGALSGQGATSTQSSGTTQQTGGGP